MKPRVQSLLVADDSPLRQRATADLLRAEGYEVTLASSSDEAVAELARVAFDGVVIEARLPRSGGIEACGRLRRLAGRERTVILLLRANEMMRTAGLEAGADDVLLWSHGLDAVLSRLRELFWKKTQTVTRETQPTGRASPAGASPSSARTTGVFAPDSSRVGVPDSSRAGVPDSSRAGVPDSSRAGVPDSSRANVPESTSTPAQDSTRTRSPDSSRSTHETMMPARKKVSTGGYTLDGTSMPPLRPPGVPSPDVAPKTSRTGASMWPEPLPKAPRVSGAFVPGAPSMPSIPPPTPRLVAATGPPNELFDLVVMASGLSDVLARGTIERACLRAGIDPASMSGDDLSRALPALRNALGVFLAPDELDRRISVLGALASSSRAYGTRKLK